MGDLWGRILRWIRGNEGFVRALSGIAAVMVAVIGVVATIYFGVSANNGLTLEDAQALVEAEAARWQGLTREQEQTVRKLERQIEINQGAFQSFFAVIHEQNVPQEQWPARLVAIADRNMALRKQVQSIPVNDGSSLELKQKVEAAIAAVRHDEADALLVQMLELQGVGRDAIWASRGELAMTRLRYADAAHHFSSAANALPPTQEIQKLTYLEQEAGAWVHQGDEFGDNAALEKSIELYKKLLEAYPRDRAPDDWVRIQSNLGLALLRLGEREIGTTHLEEATQAYREALKEWTRARVPLEWAMTQNNLGLALSRLGEREIGTTRLEEALQAYREALKEYTQARVPLMWAMTQNNLGNALRVLGERESGTTRLKEAVQACREALKERTQARVPLDWAMTQNNLGNALFRLGERESGTTRLEEAVQAYREALKEYTQARVPLNWAVTQDNLGSALSILGKRESGTTRLEEAVQAHREALKERTQARIPLDWAATQNNLGLALRRLGEREGGTARLEEAMVAVQNALRVAQESGASHYIYVMESNLQRIRALLAERKGKL
ncbi:MAG: tetratricopeptide repeat protein [Magnetococcales bacterium]|nr:tetratricopeptide repeat protein [Magnetococcales bacterium]